MKRETVILESKFYIYISAPRGKRVPIKLRNFRGCNNQCGDHSGYKFD